MVEDKIILTRSELKYLFIDVWETATSESLSEKMNYINLKVALIMGGTVRK